jgi:hypothetical protein
MLLKHVLEVVNVVLLGGYLVGAQEGLGFAFFGLAADGVEVEIGKIGVWYPATVKHD